jgi:hypothetical protein
MVSPLNTTIIRGMPGRARGHENKKIKRGRRKKIKKIKSYIVIGRSPSTAKPKPLLLLEVTGLSQLPLLVI